MYQAGTLSGNPVAMNAGITALEILKEPGTYETLEERSGRLEKGLLEAADAGGVPIAINRVGSMITPFFVRLQRTEGDQLQRSNRIRHAGLRDVLQRDARERRISSAEPI